ncbi:MAG: tetratricopeptide repeat protein [Candidatus Hydrothermarchaeaceae archaeon]
MNEKTKELLLEGAKFFKEKNFGGAEQCFKKALEVEPENALIHNNYATLLKKMEQYDLAEKHYRTALEIEPGNVQIQKNYGSLLKAKIAAAKSEEAKS